MPRSTSSRGSTKIVAPLALRLKDRSRLWRVEWQEEVVDPEGIVPRSLREVVMRALEKNPDDRYQSAAEFRSALLEKPQPAPRKSTPEATEVLARAPGTERSAPPIARRRA